MLSLSPPPPWLMPPPQKQNKPSPSHQIIISKQAWSKQKLPPEVPCSTKQKPGQQHILLQPRKTNLVIWFGAILCLVFSLFLIFFGIATLIIFLAIKPRNPMFDVPTASLNVIYLDTSEFLNSDIAFLANFSNPNKKLGVKFEYLNLNLYFLDSLIATQAVQPFTERSRDTQLISVHMISSLVYMPPNLALELQKQVRRNRVVYNIRGTFRVKIKLGLIHYSHWLNARCELEMTSPPTGILVSHSCRTKR